MVLLHGFGASVFSWRDVMAPLAELGRVVGFDRPAYGLTQRPLPGEWMGENPYSADAQVTLTLGLMNELGVDRAILVGNEVTHQALVGVTLYIQHQALLGELQLVQAEHDDNAQDQGDEGAVERYPQADGNP